MSRRRPWPRRTGLRARVVAGLLLASVTTLATAAAFTAPQLGHRLRQDRVDELRDLARTARPTLRHVPRADVRPGDPALTRLADRLEQRTGGRIAIVDAAGRALTDTAPARPEPVIPDLADEAAAPAGRDGVRAVVRGDRAFAVTSVRGGGQVLTLVLAKRLTDTRAAADSLRSALWRAGLAGLVVAALLAVVLSRSLMSRLERLGDDARLLGAEGLRHPVTVRGYDEVASVAARLEEMRVRLLEEESSRQAFLATASHELRTPLAALQATLELIQEGPDDQGARAGTALRQVHRLSDLATDLLDLSRVDADAPLHPEPLELLEHARTVTREHAARLEAAGRALSVAGAPAHALADPAAVARALLILVDNAVKHGVGPIHVAIAAQDEQAVIRVSDTGPGPPPEAAPTLFVRFARGPGRDRVPGAGLGLPIARGLARAQGGEVVHEGGATFAVRLPAWRQPALTSG